jgi:hypothetical protein
LLKRTAQLIALSCFACLAAAPAQGGGARAGSCGANPYSYAGLRSDRKAHGVAATIAPVTAPAVSSGHVAGWVGVSGAGPGGTGGWIQAGLATFSGEGSSTSELYFEVAPPGARPYAVQIDPDVAPGDAHRVAVLEMSGRQGWWRVWVDKRPVSPPIHLAGSQDGWYPQAVGENSDGGVGSCNTYAYRFADVAVAQASGGIWRGIDGNSVFADPGYQATQLSSSPRSFIASSL